jgi:hypothetical protein
VETVASRVVERQAREVAALCTLRLTVGRAPARKPAAAGSTNSTGSPLVRFISTSRLATPWRTCRQGRVSESQPAEHRRLRQCWNALCSMTAEILSAQPGGGWWGLTSSWVNVQPPLDTLRVMTWPCASIGTGTLQPTSP